jgi:hypothetical protein
MTRLRWSTALLVALTLLAAACGGDDGGGSSDGDDETSTAAAAPPEDEGQVLIEEDFDDDDNLWRPDDLDIEGEQDLSIDDGALVTEWTTDAFADLPDDQTVIPNQLWPTVLDGVIDDLADTRVEAEVSFEAPGVAGLACRIAEVSVDAGDLRAYFFQVSSTGQVNLAESDEEGTVDALEVIPELDEDERDEVDELPVEGAPFELDDDESYELGLTCVDGEDGVELSGTIDGEEVISATDDEDPIDDGTAGLLSGQSRLATEVDGFDAFEVAYESATITNLGDEIDEDDLDEAAEEAEGSTEAAPETTESAPDSPVSPDLINSPALGAPTDPTTIPEYGSDSDFDLLAADCYLANFESCDQLYLETPAGSGYEAYGGTCGGRLEVSINADCLNAGDFAEQAGSYPASSISEFGTDAAFDELALGCEEGDLEACDDLYLQTPVDSGYEEYGSTCGARTTTLYDGDCIGD